VLTLATNLRFGAPCEARRWILASSFADASDGRSSSDDNKSIQVFWMLRVISNFTRVFYVRLEM